jgi:hypothetical protein
MMSRIKTITSVLKTSTDIISARPIRLTDIKVITSVLKTLTDIISARPIRLAEGRSSVDIMYRITAILKVETRYHFYLSESDRTSRDNVYQGLQN